MLAATEDKAKTRNYMTGYMSCIMIEQHGVVGEMS
jgi:hypothetical protein